jgi:hypothetical protein
VRFGFGEAEVAAGATSSLFDPSVEVVIRWLAARKGVRLELLYKSKEVCHSGVPTRLIAFFEHLSVFRAVHVFLASCSRQNLTEVSTLTLKDQKDVSLDELCMGEKRRVMR